MKAPLSSHPHVFAALFAPLLAAACQSSTGGIERTPGRTSTLTSTASGGSGGGGTATGSGGSGGEAGANQVAGAAGEGAGAASSGGGAAESTNSGGGSSNTGTGGTTTAGTGGTGIQVPDCTFHTPPFDTEAAGGQGGAGSEDIHLDDSNFIGDYLVDSAGFSLYIYGADFPGDCNTPPVTNCYDDCVLAWPVFDAGARSLGEGLVDEAFGTFTRSDGLQQTTYLGWPLYYYVRDVEAGELIGHDRGSIWFAAETELPNIMVMRASEANGGIRYLGTERGYTLYAYANDVAGTIDSTPESSCTDGCLDDYAPFAINSFRPASPINPSDVTIFLRADGQVQLAYKGMPLYTSHLDTQSGQLNGAAVETFSVVEL